MKVVEGSAFVAAPLGGMTLAQLGADVIRFDPIGGGLDYRRWPITDNGMSLFWAGMNKGKRSFQVDIGHPEGRELIMELLRGDSQEDGIFLTNFPERGWLAYEKLKQVREDLIYVNIMGDRKGGSALDYTVNCAVGFASATGDPSNENPTNYLLPAWDNITGQMSAVALLAADRYRHINGEGQLVKIALKDVAVATASNLGNISEVTINNEDRQKAGNYLYGAFGRDFVSKDGVRVMIVGLTPRQWKGIVEAMGIADQVSALEADLGYSLSGEGERFKARHKIAELVEPWFACKAYSEICPLFDEHAVCYGPYRSFREMVEDDDDCSLDNPMMEMVTQPNIGEYLASGSPIRFVGDNLETLPAPTLGQHTEEILKQELSLSDGQVGRLKAQGIVAW
ncbi:MAG: 2-methylfumaryl-CoA isomerase [Gammaproteobacteria bacterium]|jgi:2-methylfumaryl-CoA isomerase|nr:2-methylfumaryl-CoA isomerase [Gammaproteobacteria bacterium]MBT5685707.1 2-methylfumaryl-CoA isomerase [Gammaproteobacteria bacterium]MBT6893024.1 2-methylfumaryl-CoA isomerase [Gammaproteobacteria bacterium]